jgi:hypothetical protein
MCSRGLIYVLRTTVHILLAVGIGAAQPRGKTASVFQDPSRPGVYISFERTGRRLPMRVGETSEGWFLKIHNNTRWSLTLESLGDGPKQNGDADLVYDVIEDPQGYPPSPIPAGNWFDLVSEASVRAGKSLDFSVPKAKLGEGLGIKVRFNYEWDAHRTAEPEHTIAFYHSELPASFRKGEKRRPSWMEGTVPGDPALPTASPLPAVLTPHPATLPPPVRK